MARLARLRTAVRLRTDVHRYALEVLDALGRPPVGDDVAASGVRTLEVGPDPLRVLLVGGGIAVGYGVRSRAEALDGPLARAVALATGRGVVLDNRAVPHVRTAEVRQRLAVSGAHTFRLVIWAPSFAEGMERLSLTAWRNDLLALVDALRAEHDVAVLLTHMPVPSGIHPTALVARPWVHRMNRMIAGVAASRPGVLDVATEPFFPGQVGDRIIDAAYFRRVTRRLTPPVLTLLGYADRVAGALEEPLAEPVG